MAKTTSVPSATLAPAPRGPLSMERSGGVPGWVWGVGFALIAVLLWRMFSTRRNATAVAPSPAGAGYGAPPAGYGAGYGPMGTPPSTGSGMLGTGIAAAGGLAAGMLVERLLEGRHEHGVSGAASSAGLLFDDAPGRNEAADELERRSVDFGSGDDWGGGSDNAGGDGW